TARAACRRAVRRPRPAPEPRRRPDAARVCGGRPHDVPVDPPDRRRRPGVRSLRPAERRTRVRRRHDRRAVGPGRLTWDRVVGPRRGISCPHVGPPSGCWKKHPISAFARVSVKALVLLVGWLVASIAPLLAILLWKFYGGSLYLAELSAVTIGHLLNAGLTVS